MICRRSFLAALAGLPIVGRLCPAAWGEPKIIRFRQVVDHVDITLISMTTGTVNSTEWMGRPAQCWRCNGFNFTRLRNGRYEVIAEFQRGERSVIVVDGTERPLYNALDFNKRDFGERIA